MNSNIRIQSILERYPEIEQIFQMYEVELSDDITSFTIEQLCEEYDLDIEDVIMDIEEVIEDSKQTEWLANGSEEDQWTEHFTEESSLNTGAKEKQEGFEENSEEYYDSEEY